MDKSNIEFLMDIFKELTTEMPQEMIYCEEGDSIGLKSIERPWNNGWNTNGNIVFEAA